MSNETWRCSYYQILADFYAEGAQGLRLLTPGSKSDYRRTLQVMKRVVRCRFLDPDASAAVIAQKIRQALADKTSGNQIGIWFLLPEPLRLGTWDLMCGGSGFQGLRVRRFAREK